VRVDAESLTSSSPKAKFILKPVDHEMATPWSEHQYGGSGRDDAIPRREAVTDYTLMMQQQDVLAWCFFFFELGLGVVTSQSFWLRYYITESCLERERVFTRREVHTSCHTTP